jgi:hypothetical protein
VEELMRRTLLDRLDKLEKHSRLQPPPPPSAEELLFQAKVAELLGQMDQNYSESVYEDLRSGGDSRPFSALTIAFIGRVLGHLQEGTPLALPAAVAEAYVLNPNTEEDGACELCGYKLPLELFTICPVCGRGSVFDLQILSARKNAERMTPK